MVLAGDEGRHAVVVRRTRVGEQLQVADGAGRVVTAQVAAVDGSALRLTVVRVREVPPPQLRFVLVQSLAKGGRDEQAIESATELGVDEVVPWQASRCVVQWRADRVGRGLARWDGVLAAATKQSRRVRRPVLGDPVTTAQLTARIRDAQGAFVLHEGASLPLATQELPERGEVLLVVGPEGGIPDEELAVLTGAGALAVRLGENVLRSSTAGPAALAVLSARVRWASATTP